MTWTRVGWLGCEYNDFVELGNISEEVIDAGSFRCPPAMLALEETIRDC